MYHWESASPSQPHPWYLTSSAAAFAWLSLSKEKLHLCIDAKEKMRSRFGAWHAPCHMFVSVAGLTTASDPEMCGAIRCNGRMCAKLLTDECMRRTFLIRDIVSKMMLNGLVQDTALLELSIMHCMPSLCIA